jgi:hypothetical protein
MASPEFTLRVPARAPFLTLACDVVGRFIDLRGGSEADRAAVASALLDAMETLVAGRDADIDLSCTAGPSGLAITLQSGGGSTVVRHSSGAVTP